MEKLKELESKVIDWATDRNFFGEGGATLFAQYLKLREEFGELSGNFAKGKCMKDDIGDCAVVLIIMNRLSGGETIFTPFTYEFNEAISYFRGVQDSKLKYLLMDGGICDMVTSSNAFKDKLNNFKIPIILVMIHIFAEENGYDFTECLEHSYNEIKDRKGEWINNIFVKESDLK